VGNGYVTLFVRRRAQLNQKTEALINDLQKLRIKHKIVDVTEKIELYGNKVTLEGAFAMDFSENGKVKVPTTPLATVDDKLFNGLEEIKSNLEFLRKNYSE